MSDRKKFFILLALLLASLVLAWLINSSYAHVLVGH